MPSYFEFEVSLRGIEPRIWRRFLLPAEDSTFGDLHEAIQQACGWDNSHMFLFRSVMRLKTPIAGIPSEEDSNFYGFSVPQAELVALNSFFCDGGATSCVYEYDFGDGWLHDLSVVRVLDLPEKVRRRLLAGERAFPPEDCGGPSGYRRFVSFLKTGVDEDGEDPKHLAKWLGDWGPERFDLEAVKAKFDRPRPRKAKATSPAES